MRNGQGLAGIRIGFAVSACFVSSSKTAKWGRMEPGQSAASQLEVDATTVPWDELCATFLRMIDSPFGLRNVHHDNVRSACEVGEAP